MNSLHLPAWGPEAPLFVRLLAAEVAVCGQAQTGARIGMSRTAVSLILANKYRSPSTAGVERRVMATLGRVHCVPLSETISRTQCQSYREKPAPTHNPPAMQQWRACQHCPINPEYDKENSHARLH